VISKNSVALFSDKLSKLIRRLEKNMVSPWDFEFRKFIWSSTGSIQVTNGSSMLPILLLLKNSMEQILKSVRKKVVWSPYRTGST
jgi:hypothetical protein